MTTAILAIWALSGLGFCLVAPTLHDSQNEAALLAGVAFCVVWLLGMAVILWVVLT